MSSTVRDLPRRHGFSRDDYYRMAAAGILGEDDRVELIEGAIIDMAPIGSRHGGAVMRLDHALQQVIGPNAQVSVQNPLLLNDRTEPQPDLLVLRPRPDFYSREHPGPADVFLLIEVAETSLVYDRDVKLPLYAAHGISEAWLVDLEGGRLGVYRQPGPAGYREQDDVTNLAQVPLPSPLGGALDLRGLFDG